MMQAVHETYMRQAMKEARFAYDKDEVPVGAVIVHKGQIIARAHNQVKLLKDPTAHAEMIAITQAAAYLKNERLLDCDVYVTIEPCPMCAGAMVLARVRGVCYATDDPKSGACGSVVNILQEARLNHRVKTRSDVLKDESRSLIREFFQKKRLKSGEIA